MLRRSYTLWTAIGIALVVAFCLISFALGGDLWVISLLMLPPLVAAATTTPIRTMAVSGFALIGVIVMGPQGATTMLNAAHATRLAVVALASVLAVQTAILRERDKRTRRRLALLSATGKLLEEAPGVDAVFENFTGGIRAAGFADWAFVERDSDGVLGDFTARTGKGGATLFDHAPADLTAALLGPEVDAGQQLEAMVLSKSLGAESVGVFLLRRAEQPRWDNVDLAEAASLMEQATQRARSAQLMEDVVRAERELRKSRDEIAAIISGVASGVVAQRPGGEIVYANEAAAGMLDAPAAAALVGRNFPEVIRSLGPTRQDGNEFDVGGLPGFRALAGEVAPSVLIHWRANAADEEHWALIRATAVVNERDEPALAIAVLEDNTERMRMFTTLQQSLLPAALPELPGVTLSSSFRPAERDAQVGGDFYDAFRLPDGSSLLVIGDVCGKGPEAAALTALTRYTIRAAAMHESSPQKILQVVNEAIIDQVDDGRFCTIGLVRLQPSAPGEVLATAISAGHPVPVIAGKEPARTLGEHGTLLGVVDEPQFSVANQTLKSGEFIALYTDGLSAGETTEDARYAAQLIDRTQLDSARPIASQLDAAAIKDQDEPGRDDVAILVALVA